MPIRASSSAELRGLLDALEGAEDVNRESAIARLAVIGQRAADHLLRIYPTETRSRTRTGMLRALEACGDPRVVPLAREALQDATPDVALTAVAVLKSFLTSHEPKVAADALDALLAAAMDRSRESGRRVAALDALKELPDSTAEPVRRTLANDPDPEVRKRVSTMTAPEPGGAQHVWGEALDGKLPASPDALKKAVASVAGSARLTEVLRLIDVVRARENRETDPQSRAEWRAVRGALHQALATRGSRLGLYDLRESLLDPDRLPVAFIAALEDVGDASCLEPLAAAYDASSHGSDPWWRDHLAVAFRAIVHREGLTRRHAAVKRAMMRWPEAAADLMAKS